MYFKINLLINQKYDNIISYNRFMFKNVYLPPYLDLFILNYIQKIAT